MTQHLHILGICGTFMGSIAQLAKAMGYRVTGSDKNVYPPMSTQLEQAGIELIEGFDESQLDDRPDLVVVGNVVSRGNPAMEYVLNHGIPYISGPQWLAENWLHKKWVLAVAGTHGKTTTSSMLAWILEFAGYQPGYLIGGVPGNFETSARLGESDFFVIEADEYDTAFFDKRAKFVHYRPRTAIVGNLEYDHADIYPDLASIQKQFHHLMRMLPSDGLCITPEREDSIEAFIEQGFWSQRQTVGSGGDWQAEITQSGATQFLVRFAGDEVGEVVWGLTGIHNVNNALAAMAAARHVGVEPKTAVQALAAFKGVKRRMELLADASGFAVYDDFAHHPTAIETTLAGLRAKEESDHIIAVIEPRSNTMKMGVHQQTLAASANNANTAIWFDSPDTSWSLGAVVGNSDGRHKVVHSLDDVVSATVEKVKAQVGKTHVVIMSNGGFGGVHQRIVNALSKL